MAEAEITKIEAGSDAISNVLTDKGKKKYGRFVFADLGRIPWVG